MAAKAPEQEVRKSVDDYIEEMLDTLGEEERVEVQKCLDSAPTFRPAKALKASVKADFKAGAAAFQAMQQDIQANSADVTYVSEVSSHLVRLAERMLESIALKQSEFDTWSMSIPMDLIEIVYIIVVLKQTEILGKSENSGRS